MRNFLFPNFMNKALKFSDFKFWRYLINFWTFLLFMIF